MDRYDFGITAWTVLLISHNNINDWHIFWCVVGRYDFGITAWTVLLIKSRGAEHVSSVYVNLATHGEDLGILVALAAIGGMIGGIIGRKARVYVCCF